MLRFNFAELKESKFEKYVRPDLIFLVFVLLLVFAVYYFWVSSIESQISAVDSKIARLRAEKARLLRVQREVGRLKKLEQELKHKLSVVSELERKRHVPQFLYFFGNPDYVKGIWLTELSSKGKLLHVKGATFNVKRVPLFLQYVETNLGNVVFRETKRKVFSDRRLRLNIPYYQFNFSVEMKNGAAK
ncbi:Fimbrial assembly family protein [Thermovibrio ammonificans HB-1]|uniref:Fimbrial assembly family protein n=1 Tax=Thermovibrio ammonificans (strain DSM 15698 / JCM 12110 / HB-1) TaxID=648996 RepID=E8T1X2_THEA1|nr:fimbrial assembly protein [Thermovibrio ammonificans]ADU96867.1 Fimbrial assembly family protein [Thermovibrio ammonificans HB-1]